MRIDIVTIFPDYLAPLELSLAGKAQDKGLLDVRSTTCVTGRRTDTAPSTTRPYGGGAGMVMKPEPWGAAFDALLAAPRAADLIFTTPPGEPFTQALARELAGRERLVFACGRYEGIDQRVVDDVADPAEVREISLGDYVLNGGEVAALAIAEAVIRLVPGFMGNPASLVEESHEDGLLEYPVYTKPASWRGREVPPVLLSGDHAAIAAWRHDQAVRRTADRRPDLLSALTAPGRATTSAGPGAPTQASCSPSNGPAGSRRRWPTRLRDPCPPSSPSPTSWSGCSSWHDLRRAHRRAAGRAVRGRLRGRHLGHRAADGGTRPPGPGAGALVAGAHAGVAPAGATSYGLFTGGGSLRQPADVPQAGFRSAGRSQPGVVRMTKRIIGSTGLWQT